MRAVLILYSLVMFMLTNARYAQNDVNSSYESKRKKKNVILIGLLCCFDRNVSTMVNQIHVVLYT